MARCGMDLCRVRRSAMQLTLDPRPHAAGGRLNAIASWLAGWILTMPLIVISFVYFRAGDGDRSPYDPLPQCSRRKTSSYRIGWRVSQRNSISLGEPWISSRVAVTRLRLTGRDLLYALCFRYYRKIGSKPERNSPVFAGTACLTAGMLLISLGLLDRPQDFHRSPVLGAFDVMSTSSFSNFPSRGTPLTGLGGSTRSPSEPRRSYVIPSIGWSLRFPFGRGAEIVLFGDSVTQDVANQYELAEEGRLADLTTNKASAAMGIYLLLRRHLEHNGPPRHIVFAGTPEMLSYAAGEYVELYLANVFTKSDEQEILALAGLFTDHGVLRSPRSSRSKPVSSIASSQSQFIHRRLTRTALWTGTLDPPQEGAAGKQRARFENRRTNWGNARLERQRNAVH